MSNSSILMGGCLVAILLALPSPSTAAAYHPTSDAVVVAKLPGRVAGTGRPGEDRGVHAAPTDVGLALRLARTWVERSRTEGDPRYLGHALGVLRPWSEADAAPVDVVVLRATIHQALHQFPLALQELDAVLQREPRHAQALLTRATVLQVTGRFADAARDCRALGQVHGGLVAVTCATEVASLSGQGRAAYITLDDALRSPGGLADASISAWSHSVLGEMAERNGDVTAAANHFRAALALDPADRYVRAAFADLLLDQGEPAAALALTDQSVDDDNLLLRRALALRALNDPTGRDASVTLAARYAAAHLRGEALHLREEARFVLQVQGDARRALQLAKANWAVQKEPADARILLQSAVAASDRVQEQVARRWLRQAGVSPAYLQRALAGVIATKGHAGSPS